MRVKGCHEACEAATGSLSLRRVLAATILMLAIKRNYPNLPKQPETLKSKPYIGGGSGNLCYNTVKNLEPYCC